MSLFSALFATSASADPLSVETHYSPAENLEKIDVAQIASAARSENVWQFLRDNYLSNRVFKSYDDIVDHCRDAGNKLVDQPWRIMSIGLRDWAHGF